MDWKDVLREKISELELIASWGSQTGHGSVRDHCRSASSDLKRELERLSMQDVTTSGPIYLLGPIKQ